MIAYHVSNYGLPHDKLSDRQVQAMLCASEKVQAIQVWRTYLTPGPTRNERGQRIGVLTGETSVERGSFVHILKLK